MAWDTAITKPEATPQSKRAAPEHGFGAYARSRIARNIFLWNFVAFGILLIGVMLLSETRAGLTEAQVRNLRAQGELISNLLVETGAASSDYAGINEPAVREVLRRLLPPVAEGAPDTGGPRIRVFAPDGQIVADTDVLYDRLDEEPLPPIGERTDLGKSIEEAAQGVEYWRLTPWKPSISLHEEQRRALLGEISAGQRLNENGERVVSVTLPVRNVHAVLGTVTVESADVERILAAERRALAPFAAAAALVLLLSSATLTIFIARPIRRLSRAADSLRLSGATRLRLPELSKRKDEIGALSHSLEAMTGALADRIDANERFAADVSHEIKNPLASIRSAVESVRAIQDPERQIQLLGIIAQDVRRLDRLVTDIALASRIEAETARGDLERIDIAKLLSDLASAYAVPPGEANAGAPVVFRGPPPLDALVMGQAGPFGQVFRNLIDNARSFSPPGGVVTLSVEIARSRDGAWVRAKVDDQGPGVPPENLETIFERFYTQRPKGAAFGGNSGLGLSIARQIVTAHGGRIRAENIEGLNPESPVGARLIVEFPQVSPRAH
jgi:two-component system sensor histidine kinase ChvG